MLSIVDDWLLSLQGDSDISEKGLDVGSDTGTGYSKGSQRDSDGPNSPGSNLPDYEDRIGRVDHLSTTVTTAVRSLIPEMAQAVFDRFNEDSVLPTAKPEAETEAKSTLTKQELEVLRLTAEGNTAAMIGSSLNISSRTVTTHLSNIYAKLDVARSAEAVAVAFQRGLLQRSPRSKK